MQKSLVSILTPCFNSGKFIHRLLDSILAQDYPMIEMFCIDDGSTDNTQEVIKSYIPKFADKGYVLTYIHQENSGQSVAINNGLKLVNGEFLIWPDSDDFYASPESISKMVSALCSYQEEYAIVRCLSSYIDEETLNPTRKVKNDNNFCKTALFEDCLFSQNSFMWGAGNYMVRSSAIDNVIPDREIYTEKRAGQNWQMLMPILYHYKCLPLQEYLFIILERTSSHSHSHFKDYEQILKQNTVSKRVISSTLEKIPNMPNKIRAEYLKKVETQYLHKKLQTAIVNGMVKDAVSFMNQETVITGNKFSPLARFLCKHCDNKYAVFLLSVICNIV